MGRYGKRQQARQEIDSRQRLDESPKPMEPDFLPASPYNRDPDPHQEVSLYGLDRSGKLQAQPLLGVPIVSSPVKASPDARAAMVSLAQKLGIQLPVKVSGWAYRILEVLELLSSLRPPLCSRDVIRMKLCAIWATWHKQTGLVFFAQYVSTHIKNDD